MLGQENIFKSLLNSTYNTRDLGNYTSRITGKPLKKWSILRSDLCENLSEEDVTTLKKHNVLTNVDMRGAAESDYRNNFFKDRDDFNFTYTPIEEGASFPDSVDKVSDSYLTIAKSDNMTTVFKTIANAKTSVIYNCTAGKDRTGVVSAVILGLCGVDKEDIIKDYVLTRIFYKERLEYIHKIHPEVDMNIVTPCERFMEEFLDKLLSKYGSFKDYLLARGLTETEIESIQNKLL